MDIKVRPYSENGKNENGKGWSLSLELPFFDNTEIDGFYCLVYSEIKKKCIEKGIRAQSKVNISLVKDEKISLYTDILFKSERRLLFLYRLCDNRDGNGNEIIPPKKVKKQGCDGFFFKGSKTVGCKNLFDSKKDNVKARDYLSYIEEYIL